MKMKSLKFMLLSAFIMLGTSAFAVVIDVRKDNVGYQKTGTHAGTTDDPYEVYVAAAYAKDNLTIQDAFTQKNELEVEESYKVIGFNAGWTHVDATNAIDIQDELTTLTIKSKNMADLDNAFDGLGKLVDLTVSSDADTQNDLDFIIQYLNVTQKGAITTLNFENLTKVTGGLDADDVLSKDAGFTNLASVKLPKNVTALPANFLKETNITTITLPASLETINASAFEGCAHLTAIDLSKVKSVKASAFKGCVEIEELTIPAELVITGDDVFQGMTQLATLTIERKTGNVNVPAVFGGDAAVTTLNLKAVGTITAGAFTDMTSLTYINLSKCPGLVVPAGTFAANAFTKIKLAGSDTPINNIDLTNAKTSLKSLTFSAANGNIAVEKFKGFTKLAAISIPANITIGASAFEGCTALASAEFGEDVIIGASAFKGCSALATLTFSTEDKDEDHDLITIDNKAFEGTALTEVRLPDNVGFAAGKGTDAFKDCALLKKFIAGKGVTFIPKAFDGCNSLKSVVIPGSVTYIANAAFAGTETDGKYEGLAKLANVTFDYDPEAVNAFEMRTEVLNSIGTSAFENCVALTAIDLSNTALVSLNNNKVFKGCTALATITLPEEMENLTGASIFEGTAIANLDASMVDGSVNNIFGTNEENPNNTLKTLKLGAATVNANAFAYCEKLTTLTTGNYPYDDDMDALTPDINKGATIRGNAFAYCVKLATVTIADAANISAGAFDHCSALTTFTYKPEEVLNLGTISGNAFTGCKPYVLFDTNENWVNEYPAAPLNTTYGAELVATTVTTVQDKANANQFVNKFSSNLYNVIFNADDVKIYSVYVDGETAYFQACRTYDGKYYVEAGKHVILKTTEAKDVNYSIDSYKGEAFHASSVAFDDIECLYENEYPEGGELADIQAVLGMGSGDYLYRLTNTASIGFGFTAYTGATVKAGQFFIKTKKKPANADRLNIVWLDEDGNVEGEATAIKKIDSADANDGAIYNMQGVRVENAQKGIYIQNGKKFVVK